MIRVTIEEVQYLTVESPKDGDYEIIGQPMSWKPTTRHQEQVRIVLLQEMDGLNVERAIALLNDLRVWEPCTACGHAYHVGNCNAGTGYNECRCHAYETATQKELAKERDNLQHAAKEYGKLEGRVQVQTQQAERQDQQIATLTRSRDRLLSQRKRR